MFVRSRALGLLSFGATCLALGWCLGSQLVRPTALWQDAPAERPTQAAAMPSFAPVVAKVTPAVVAVRARLQNSLAGAAGAASGLADQAGKPLAPNVRNGSGFVVQRDGLVLTCRHLVLGAIALDVTLSERETFRATLVGEDEATDLALLRLEGVRGELPVLPLGDSDTLQAGDWIVAVGNPLGFAQTVTTGIVGFVGRHLPHADFRVTNDFLQISAPLNPGNSGCPVLDLAGHVVGLTTQAPAAAQGISFAVPANTLKWTLAAMQSTPDGHVRRGYLGIEFASQPNADGRRGCGALVVRVVEGQAAHRAGVRPGDVVLQVDGGAVDDARSLHERIVRSAPGTAIALQLLRDGLVRDPIVAVLGEVGPRSEHPAN